MTIDLYVILIGNLKIFYHEEIILKQLFYLDNKI